MTGKFRGVPKLLRFSSPIIIGVCIHKGGSGKTTCSIGIADELASRGYNVLLIDSDSQMDATTTILPGVDTSQKSLFPAIAMSGDIREQIYTTDETTLDIVPSSTRMASVETLLVSQSASGIQSERVFSNILKGVREDGYYDFVIIDMDKNIGVLNRSILTGCTHLLMVSEASLYNLSGFSVMHEQYESVCKTTNPDLSLLGVVLNKVMARKSIVNETMALFDESFPGVRFEHFIRQDAAVEKAQWNNISLRKYNKRSNAWRDIVAVTDELLCRIEKSPLVISR